jgi:two-component system, NarL family, sensor kinase
MVAPPEIAFAQFLAVGIGFMVLAGGVLLAFLTTYQKHMLRQQLRLRTVEAAHRQELLAAVIDAQEAERARIGQELHDGIGSTVASAKMLVSRLRQVGLAAFPTDQMALLEELMGTAAQDVRSISHNLYPAVLSRYGLADALQYLVDVCNETGGPPIELRMQYEQPLALAEELALYRICQELVHNAQKHAHGASQVWLTLHRTPAQLTLTVADDGCGFAEDGLQDATGSQRGAGLRSIEVRAQMLQATLHRTTAPGLGTRTIIQLQRPV